MDVGDDSIVIDQFEIREFKTDQTVTGEMLARLVEKHKLHGWMVDITADYENPNGMLYKKKYTITFKKWIGQE